MRQLDGGDLAVCLFNRDDRSQLMAVKWNDLNLKGRHPVRDLWAHADRGKIKDLYEAEVPAHGTVMIRISQ